MKQTLLTEMESALAGTIEDEHLRRLAVVQIAKVFGGAQVYIPRPKASDPIVQAVILQARADGVPVREIAMGCALSASSVYDVIRERATD